MKKIAFITCVNDEVEYQEACWYRNQLKNPLGYQVDFIAVHEAESEIKRLHTKSGVRLIEVG